jgi:hypothetical protein
MKCRKYVSILVLLSIVACEIPARAALINVYVAQTPMGANTGVDCANAFGATFFNTAGNWGGGVGQIGNDSVVHICGLWTGSPNSEALLTFQGSGAVGHPVTVFLEPGAILQAPYFGVNGAISINGKSHVILDGGSTCGSGGGSAGWAKVACNGLIRNTLAGSAGMMCPGGACTSVLPDGTTSSLISNLRASSDIEIKNFTLGPVYVRSKTTAQEGMSTNGILFSQGEWNDVRIHHNVIFSAGKLIVLGFRDNLVGNHHAFTFHHNDLSDHCWAIGMGVFTGGSASSTITNIQVYDNKMGGWENWAPNVTNCHGNGTMLYNFNSSTPRGTIADSTSKFYNNFIEGDHSGGLAASSPSGFLSCQDNCVDLYVFNNVLHSTCGLSPPSRSCAGFMYFNGPGGGGQHIFNNTIIASGGSCTVMMGMTSNVTIKNNIYQGCVPIEIRPNAPTSATTDYNNGFNVPPGVWMGYNTEGNGQQVTLENYRTTYLQELHTITTNPSLDGTYRLRSGSAAIGAGTNLTSLGIAALNFDVSGRPRPTSGAWDMGAFQFVAELSRPSGPVNLKVQ